MRVRLHCWRHAAGSGGCAVRHAGGLNRLLVRRAFERRFTVDAMARAYLEIYRGLPGTCTSTFANRPANGQGLSLERIGDAISVNSLVPGRRLIG